MMKPDKRVWYIKSNSSHARRYIRTLFIPADNNCYTFGRFGRHIWFSLLSILYHYVILTTAEHWNEAQRYWNGDWTRRLGHTRQSTTCLGIVDRQPVDARRRHTWNVLKKRRLHLIFDATRRPEARFQFGCVKNEIEHRLGISTGSSARDVVFGDVVEVDLFAIVPDTMIVDVELYGCRVVFEDKHVIIQTSWGPITNFKTNISSY